LNVDGALGTEITFSTFGLTTVMGGILVLAVDCGTDIKRYAIWEIACNLWNNLREIYQDAVFSLRGGIRLVIDLLGSDDLKTQQYALVALAGLAAHPARRKLVETALRQRIDILENKNDIKNAVNKFLEGLSVQEPNLSASCSIAPHAATFRAQPSAANSNVIENDPELGRPIR
jgi:hypothetical protein